jgi:hypothetical protein
MHVHWLRMSALLWGFFWVPLWHVVVVIIIIPWLHW